MSLDNTAAIDALGTDSLTGETILNIIDATHWLDESEHLSALQAKLNAYFEFVESGQINEIVPEWGEFGAKIEVLFRHPPIGAAVALLRTAEFVARPLGIKIAYRVHTPE